ncbi:hypothetical protein [Indioceanicola profundi]|uniref:hypothetical protein n=1 Tax=Indioceanicola profundi TaxID=2220096 RepID=UPI000E6ADCE3|nr:hypothetical protein [Indioceanicola profundi]
MSAATGSPAAGTRVSTAQDFPHLAVYRHSGAGGPVYRIAFDNLEYGGVRRLMHFGAIAVVTLLFPLGVWSGLLAQWAGAHWLVGVAGFGGLVWMACHAAVQPGAIARVIELDFGSDRLRVLRRGRVEIERQYSRMQNLTVQDHPEAEFARAARMERGQQTLKEIEKQHCLIGWFGAGGAEQVVLLCRAEWPNRQSLFEVRQAMLWVAAQADERKAREPVESSGINPPLD